MRFGCGADGVRPLSMTYSGYQVKYVLISSFTYSTIHLARKGRLYKYVFFLFQAIAFPCPVWSTHALSAPKEGGNEAEDGTTLRSSEAESAGHVSAAQPKSACHHLRGL
eukprot:2004793-Amphidinium_carterae.1